MSFFLLLYLTGNFPSQEYDIGVYWKNTVVFVKTILSTNTIDSIENYG